MSKKFDRIYRNTRNGVTVDIAIFEGNIPYVYLNMYEGRKKISKGMSLLEAIRMAVAILEGASKYPLIVGDRDFGKKKKKKDYGDWYQTKKGWWRNKKAKKVKEEEPEIEEEVYELDRVLDDEEEGGEEE